MMILNCCILRFLHNSTFLISRKARTCLNCCILHISTFPICIIYLHNGKRDTSVQIVIFWSVCTIFTILHLHKCTHLFELLYFDVLHISTFLHLHNSTSVQIEVFWGFCIFFTFLHLYKGTHMSSSGKAMMISNWNILKLLHILILTFLHLHKGTQLSSSGKKFSLFAQRHTHV